MTPHPKGHYDGKPVVRNTSQATKACEVKGCNAKAHPQHTTYIMGHKVYYCRRCKKMWEQILETRGKEAVEA